METQGTLQIPILSTTLKHYFPDYRNYYYLPLEDTAIHKSVATYVDSSNKVKATKQTCYVKQNDSFIPHHCQESNCSFQKDVNDKQLYQTLHSLIDSDYEAHCTYIKNTLQTYP